MMQPLHNRQDQIPDPDSIDHCGWIDDTDLEAIECGGSAPPVIVRRILPAGTSGSVTTGAPAIVLASFHGAPIGPGGE